MSLPLRYGRPGIASDFGGARRAGRSRFRSLRLAASYALVALSALLLLSSDGEGGLEGGTRALQMVGRYLAVDPIITNLARVDGTKSSSEAVERAKTAKKAVDGENGDGKNGNGENENDDNDDDDGADVVPAKSVTPVYWHIYKAGGTSIKAVMTYCLDLTVASEMGILKGHDEDTEIAVMRAGGHNYANVDTTSWKGVDRAASMGLAESGLADAVVTPIIHKTVADVFSPEHKALLFTVFRHPVDRLVSQYYYLQEASWEKTYNPDIAKESLGQYARKYNNRVIRQLIGADLKWRPLTQVDLDVAKEVVRTRMLVGLMSDVEGSVRRFMKYFGWEDREDMNVEEYAKCMEEQFPLVDEREGFSTGEGDDGKAKHGSYKSGNKHKHPKVVKGNPDWEEVAKANKWDIALYEYILEVYEEQGRTMFDGADKSAMRAASEAKNKVRLAARAAANSASEPKRTS